MNFMWRPRRRPAARTSPDTLAILGLLMLAWVPYLNTLGNAFVYDDRPQLLENPYVHSFRYLGRIFGSTVWSFQGAQGVTNYYRPLMSFAYVICYHFFGPIAFGFHLVNLVFHAGVVLLLFALTERLFGDRLLALSAAGLFALHPVHTESVAWIAGLPDLELSFFFLLTFLCYLNLERAGSEHRASWKLYVPLLASYVLALLSKEQALMLPFLAASYEHFYRDDRGATSLRLKLTRYLPLFATAAAYLVFRIVGFGGFAPSVSRPDLGWGGVILSAIALTGSYLWKLIWPVHLSAFYVFRESHSLRDPHVLAGLAALLLCLNLFVWLWSYAHDISFAFLWMGATLAPVLNARWLPAGVFAERYLYLPSVGFCWLVAWAATKAWRAAPTEKPSSSRRLLWRAMPVALGLVAILYGMRTIRRNRDWRDDEVLYQRILDEQPDAQFIRTNLGVIYFDRGDMAGAEREWTRSLGPLHPYASTLNDMGLLRSKQKRYDEAIAYFDEATRDRPNYSEPYKNLGMTYAEMDRPADAEREFRKGVELAPLNSGVRDAYGHFLLDQSRPAEAQVQFAASSENDPNADAYSNLGDLLARSGDSKKARDAYQSALALDAFDNRAHLGLAALDEQAGRNAEALQEYHASLDMDPTNAGALAGVHRLAPASPSATRGAASAASPNTTPTH
jgi:Tfp pilus assembly protein PilF